MDLRVIVLTIVLVGFLGSFVDAQVPGSAYAPGGNTVSTAFLLGNSVAQRNQLLYRPGSITGARAGAFQRIYFRYGDFNGAPVQPVTLDSVTIGFLQTSDTAFRKLPSQIDYVFKQGVQPVYFRSSLTIPQGTTNNWFALDLDQPYPYDPSRSLVVEVKFKASTNPAFVVQGKGIFTTGFYQHTYSANFVDTTGRNTNTVPHFGIDLITAAKQAKERLALQVLPNPAQGRAVVQIPEGIPQATAEIMDMSGKVVATQIYLGQSRLELPVGRLAPGKYLVMVQTEKATYEAILFRE